MTAGKTIVGFGQVERRIKMRKRHHRLNPILVKLVKHGVIEQQPFFIWLRIVALGKNPGPGEAHSKNLKSHLGKQADVFLIGVIKINPSAFRQLPILRVRLHIGHHLPGCSVVRHMGIERPLGIADFLGN